MINSIAVIGGGPSGIITLATLAEEQKFERIRLFEQRSEVGGCWVYSQDPPEKLTSITALASRTADQSMINEALALGSVDNVELPRFSSKSSTQRFLDTATYWELETNVDKSTMEFTKEPFPEEKSAASVAKYGSNTPFRHHSVVKRWIQDVYKSKRLDDHIELKTSVECVTKNPETNKWDLVLRRFGINEDYLWCESFDAVIVATGRYNVPFVPNIEGLHEFVDTPHSTVIHSKAYRSKNLFRGKKTIVVGGSISAIDAVQDLIGVASKVVISIRNTKPHVYFGRYEFLHPAVDKRCEISKIVQKTVIFKDGTSIQDVDAIIFATGFSISYPFLPHLDKGQFVIKNIYQHIFSIEDPTLAFVGNIAAGLTFKTFEWQAVLVARFLSGRTTLPPKEEQVAWFRSRFEEKGDTPSYNFLIPAIKEYFATIRHLAGNKGPGRKLPVFDDNWEQAFWTSNERRIQYFLETNFK